MIARVALAALAVTAVAAAAPAKKPHEHGTLIVLIDRSGAMQGAPLDAAKQATKAAIAALDPTDDIAVIAFDRAAFLWVRLQPAGKVKADDLARLRAGNGTTYLPALELARDTLAERNGKKHIVLLSDGEAPRDGLEDVVAELANDHATLTTIGIAGTDRNLLARLAELGNGRLWLVDDATSLSKALAIEVSTALPR